jgi:hypothetical protein
VTIDERIVDELAEDGDGARLAAVVRGTQGVADAEAHAVMLGEDDVHGVVLCGFSFVGQSEWVKEASVTFAGRLSRWPRTSM